MTTKETAPGAEVRKEFKHILYICTVLGKPKSESEPYFWDNLENLKRKIRIFLNGDITQLTKLQLLQLSAIVSKYRPIEPHSFLTKISLLFKEDYSLK